MNAENQKIQELVGAIVLLTQSAEHLLKFLTPFMVPNDDASLKDILKQMSASKKQTFGQLVGKFVKESQSDTDDVRNHLESLISIRNEVVHHFTETYGTELSAGDSESVIARLQGHVTNIRYFRDSLTGAAVQLLDALCNVTFKDSPDLECFEELRKNLEQSIASY